MLLVIFTGESDFAVLRHLVPVPVCCPGLEIRLVREVDCGGDGFMVRAGDPAASCGPGGSGRSGRGLDVRPGHRRVGRRYGRPVRYDWLPKETNERKQYALTVGEDGMRLFQALLAPDAPARLRWAQSRINIAASSLNRTHAAGLLARATVLVQLARDLPRLSSHPCSVSTSTPSRSGTTTRLPTGPPASMPVRHTAHGSQPCEPPAARRLPLHGLGGRRGYPASQLWVRAWLLIR